MQLYGNTGGFRRAGIGGGILLRLFFGLFGSGGVVVLGMEFCLGNLQPLLRDGADADEAAKDADVT